MFRIPFLSRKNRTGIEQTVNREVGKLITIAHPSHVSHVLRVNDMVDIHVKSGYFKIGPCFHLLEEIFSIWGISAEYKVDFLKSIKENKGHYIMPEEAIAQYQADGRYSKMYGLHRYSNIFGPIRHEVIPEWNVVSTSSNHVEICKDMQQYDDYMKKLEKGFKPRETNGNRPDWALVPFPAIDKLLIHENGQNYVNK